VFQIEQEKENAKQEKKAMRSAQSSKTAGGSKNRKTEAGIKRYQDFAV